MEWLLSSSSAFASEVQEYLFQARQMQAMSFIVHIPLVCFGIAFPAMILFVEWRFLRTGDELYRTLARRWTKILVALFAAGVVTGTILSFEMGLLWPNFTSTFGSVFGLGFAIEGFSFFLEAIFIGVYVYGWDRMSPRAHFLSGTPIAVAGVIGSIMVISVNGWMNHPQGFELRDGQVVNVSPVDALFGNSYFWHEFVHMYIAAFMVTGFLIAGAYAVGRLRGRWGRYERTALAVPLTAAAVAAPLQILVGDWAAREVATNQPIKLAAIEGLGQTTRGAPEHLLGFYTNGQVEYGIEIPNLLSLLAFHNPNAVVQGLNVVPRSRSAAGERDPLLVPDNGWDRHAAGVARRRIPVHLLATSSTARHPLVLPGRRGGRSIGVRRAGGRLGDHRGWSPALGRLQGHANFGGGHRCLRNPGRLRNPRIGLRHPRVVRLLHLVAPR